MIDDTTPKNLRGLKKKIVLASIISLDQSLGFKQDVFQSAVYIVNNRL